MYIVFERIIRNARHVGMRKAAQHHAAFLFALVLGNEYRAIAAVRQQIIVGRLKRDREAGARYVERPYECEQLARDAYRVLLAGKV